MIMYFDDYGYLAFFLLIIMIALLLGMAIYVNHNNTKCEEQLNTSKGYAQMRESFFFKSCCVERYIIIKDELIPYEYCEAKE